MKQYITAQQWDELSRKQRKILWDSGCTYFSQREAYYQPAYKVDEYVSIGGMIEFLGDDWMRNLADAKGYTTMQWMNCNDVCDALWEAVKNKLSKAK